MIIERTARFHRAFKKLPGADRHRAVEALSLSNVGEPSWKTSTVYSTGERDAHLVSLQDLQWLFANLGLAGETTSRRYLAGAKLQAVQPVAVTPRSRQ